MVYNVNIMTDEILIAIRDKLSHVPSNSGVYMMRDIGGAIIYIGKAKNLKNRLGSYFKSKGHDAKVTAMLLKVVDFDYFITKSELDALGLEANLVRKHMPHYNILLKDDKKFPYIKITNAEYPRFEVVRAITKRDKGDNVGIKSGNVKSAKSMASVGAPRLFGPYFNGIWASELLDTLTDIFPLRTCSDKELKSGKPCMNYQIGKCAGVCAGVINREEYLKIVEKAGQFLRGEYQTEARRVLGEKMQKAAEMEQFEIAIRYRKGIEFLDKLKDRTITQIPRDMNCDVFATAWHGNAFVVSVLTVRGGALIGINNYESLVGTQIQDEGEMLSSFIMQYYVDKVPPSQVVSKYDMEDVSLALGIAVVNPKAAVKKKLLEMADENAREYLETSIEKIKHKQDFTVGASDELGALLGIENLRKIECYDISHTAGEEQVGSMTVFIDGVPARKLYRRFKIKHTEGNNDYLSLQEVLKRRIARIGTNDPSFGPRPDLIVLDGGKGQLSSVMEILPAGVFNVVSLAEQNEEIFLPNDSVPIVLPRRSYALRLVQRIRDEAHRFANDYHKMLRSKAQIPTKPKK